MDAEGDDLKQYEPVPDAPILAAVERAMRHGTPEVWIAGVVEHLGFRFSASNARQVRADLERLSAPPNRYLSRSKRHARDHWTLTEIGKARLQRQREAGEVGTAV